MESAKSIREGSKVKGNYKGELFALLNEKGILNLYRLRDRTSIFQLNTRSYLYSLLRFSSDNELFAYQSQEKIYIYSLEDGKLQNTLIARWTKENLENFIFTSNSEYIAASYGVKRQSGLSVSAPTYDLTSHGRIRLWNVEDGKMIKTFRGHRKYTSNLRVNSEKHLLVSYGGDRIIRFWNLPTKD